MLRNNVQQGKLALLFGNVSSIRICPGNCAFFFSSTMRLTDWVRWTFFVRLCAVKERVHITFQSHKKSNASTRLPKKKKKIKCNSVVVSFIVKQIKGKEFSVAVLTPKPKMTIFFSFFFLTTNYTFRNRCEILTLNCNLWVQKLKDNWLEGIITLEWPVHHRAKSLKI